MGLPSQSLSLSSSTPLPFPNKPWLYSIIERTKSFRWLFLAVSVIGVSLDSMYSRGSLTGVYILILVVSAFAFRNTLVLAIVSLVFTMTRYFLTPSGFPHVDVVIFNFLGYFCMVFAISELIKRYTSANKGLITLIQTAILAIDARDKYTAFHSRNVAYYAQLIARKMELPRRRCRDIYFGGLVHDIGKIGISDSILTKPSPLTDDEYKKIKDHPVIGYQMLKHVNTFQKRGILDIIKYHHERYDGKGYPDGLAGDSIPLYARIVAVADTFDAMTSHRVYRPDYEFDRVVSDIRNNRGTQFDPEVVDTFLEIVDQEGIGIVPVNGA